MKNYLFCAGLIMCVAITGFAVLFRLLFGKEKRNVRNIGIGG